MNMILHGRDDFGIEKSGFLWKHTKNSFKSWKQYYFVLTRLCFICYHRGSNGIQGKNPKLKIDLSEIKKINFNDKKGKKKQVKQFTVHYNDKGSLVLKSETEDLCKEWVEALKDSTEICSTRKKVHLELRRASFKRNVEQNVRDKFDTHRFKGKSEDLPKVTYLNRIPWDERIRSFDEKSGNFTTKSFPPTQVSLSPEKRCYTYNENIVLSTPDISISQINHEHRRNSLKSSCQNINLGAIQENNHHLDLSKSFSSDDVRKLGMKPNWIFNRTCNKTNNDNQIDNQGDTDSGQGSEELYNFSDSVDNEENINTIKDNNTLYNNDNQLKSHDENDSLDSQHELTSSHPMTLASKVEWMKDDSLNYSDDNEICFNGGLFPCNQRIKAEPTTVKISESSNRNTVYFSSNPNPSLPRSPRKWSSDLDLVPEEQELGYFSPRGNSKPETMLTFKYDYELTRQPPCSYSNNSNEDNDCNSYVNSMRSQCSSMYRESAKKPVLPRYSVPVDLTYQSHRDGETYIDGYTYYSPDNYTKEEQYNNFGRQNKLYHSLDSSLTKFKSSLHKENEPINYKYQQNPDMNAFKSNGDELKSQAAPSNQFERVLKRLNNRKRSNNTNRHSLQFEPPSCATHLRNELQRGQYRNSMFVTSGCKPNYRGNMYYNSDRPKSRSATYHGYEESETNFSEPDESFSDIVTEAWNNGSTGFNGMANTKSGKPRNVHSNETDDLLNNSKFGDTVYFV